MRFFSKIFGRAFLFFGLELVLVNQAFAAMQMTVPEVTESDDLDYLGKVPGILRWTPVPGTSYYEVDISRTDDFVKFRHFKLDHKNRFHIRVYPSIQYYWKVIAFSEGDQILAESETFPYKVIYTGEGPKESEPMVLTAEMEASDPTPIDEAEIGEPQDLDQPPTAQIQVDEFFKKHKLWISTEVGQMFFRQQNPILGDLEFDGILFPGLGVSYQTPKYWQRLHFEAALFILSGQFQWNSPDVALSSSNFLWSRFGINGFYTAYQFEMSQRQVDVDLHFGLSHMQTPIFSTTEPSLLAINDVRQIQAQLGVELRTHLYKKWGYFLRTSLALPVSSESQFIAVSPEFSYVIDAQVSANYHFSQSWYVGSSLKTSVVHLNEELLVFGTDTATGSRALNIYSTEFRLGYSF